MEKDGEELLNNTIIVWQPLSPNELSKEDAVEIIQNMTALFRFLIELDKKYGQEIQKKS